jgi:hypothetical protein|tara:strand:- start:994 stop:1149 length:156 start_codon:yes stop_codon:yes gene_type:complete
MKSSKMENKQWDRNEYQGRSKQQVEGNEFLAGVSVIGLLTTLIGILIYSSL